MINGVAIYGGFAGTESTVSERTDFSNGGVNETILSGDIGIVDDNSDNCRQIFNHDEGLSLNSTAVLDGFTITSGHGDRGSGMFNWGSSPTITNCTFLSNSSTYGAGMFNGYCSPSLTNCIFISNSATDVGGGVLSFDSSPNFTNCTFSANSATSGGGGLYLSSCSATFNNCIIWGNICNQYDELYLSGGTTTLNYSCYGNSSGDVYGTPVTSNCITSDPQFATASSYPYNIYGTSPCADAGNDSYNSQDYDIRGEGFPRKLNKTTGETGVIDMGAYEYKYANDYYDADGSLPVELTSFTAECQSGGVLLKWSTESEIENLGFIIQRRISVGANHDLPTDWSQTDSYISDQSLEGHGSTTQRHDYQYTDTQVQPGVTYLYRLGDVNYSGNITWHNTKEITVEAGDIQVATSFGLQKAYPNPFNPSVTLRYNLTKDAETMLQIYNMRGQLVEVLESTYKLKGTYHFTWQPEELSAGVYIVRLQSGSQMNLQKVVFVK